MKCVAGQFIQYNNMIGKIEFVEHKKELETVRVRWIIKNDSMSNFAWYTWRDMEIWSDGNFKSISEEEIALLILSQTR